MTNPPQPAESAELLDLNMQLLDGQAEDGTGTVIRRSVTVTKEWIGPGILVPCHLPGTLRRRYSAHPHAPRHREPSQRSAQSGSTGPGLMPRIRGRSENDWPPEWGSTKPLPRRVSRIKWIVCTIQIVF